MTNLSEGPQGMKRKVRKDFDKTKEYSVDVSKCTEEEKKEVQQAFFDAGILWAHWGNTYHFLEAVQYTNTKDGGNVMGGLMWSGETYSCNMTAQEFLDIVYEPPEQQGHMHAELMAMYAEDAKTTDKPWELWEFAFVEDKWRKLGHHPYWDSSVKYRRKPKTKLIHGVEIPIFEFTPKVGERFYVANVGLPEFFEKGYHMSEGCTFTQRMIERGLIYPFTEEGKQAAILHTKAMLGGCAV